MQSDAQDHSMHFYDSLAIPLLRSRPQIPSSYPLTTISHLVKAQDAQLAADHLHDITTADPTTIPLVVSAIRKHLLPSRTRLRPPSTHHAPYLLHRLVLTVPYFYRYIATPPFFRALYRLATYPTAAHATRMLFAGWARDLRRMAPQNDPAAHFWIMASRRVARKMSLPTPAHHQRFLCPIPADYCSFPSATKMAPVDVTASLRLLEQLVAAKRRKDVSKQSAKSADTPRRRKATRTSAIDPNGKKDGREERAQNPRYAMLNAKVMSVLRRHEDLMGRSDPYYVSPPTLGDHCGWSPVCDESSGLLPRMAFSSRSGSTMGSRVSVAKLARENARRKISESQASLSMSCGGWEREFWSGKGGEWLFDDELELGCSRGGVESWSGRDFEGNSFACAFTPSTFAQIEVGSEDSVLAKVSEQEMELAIESVGNTVKLPELEAFGVRGELVAGSGEMGGVSIGKRILRFMTSGVGVGGKGGDDENGSPVGSSSCRLLPRRIDGNW